MTRVPTPDKIPRNRAQRNVRGVAIGTSTAPMVTGLSSVHHRVTIHPLLQNNIYQQSNRGAGQGVPDGSLPRRPHEGEVECKDRSARGSYTGKAKVTVYTIYTALQPPSAENPTIFNFSQLTVSIFKLIFNSL